MVCHYLDKFGGQRYCSDEDTFLDTRYNSFSLPRDLA